MSPEPNKYLFDRHNFDLGADFDPDNPPAPMFSEDELAAARAAGFADGVQKGLSDAQSSRDQQIVALTQKLAADIKTLLAAEDARAEKFESELITLAQHILTQAFPILNDTLGADQIAQMVTDILHDLPSKAAIVVETSTNDHDDLSQRLKPHLTAHEGQILILPATDIAPGSFRMKWQDGGALRDTGAILTQLQSALASALAQSHPKTID